MAERCGPLPTVRRWPRSRSSPSGMNRRWSSPALTWSTSVARARQVRHWYPSRSSTASRSAAHPFGNRARRVDPAQLTRHVPPTVNNPGTVQVVCQVSACLMPRRGTPAAPVGGSVGTRSRPSTGYPEAEPTPPRSCNTSGQSTSIPSSGQCSRNRSHMSRGTAQISPSGLNR